MRVEIYTKQFSRYSNSLRDDGPGIESRGGGGKDFPHPPRPALEPTSLLHNGYRVSLSGVKRPERGVNRPPQSSAEVKERVELCIYFPSAPSWPVLGRIFFFFCFSLVPEIFRKSVRKRNVASCKTVACYSLRETSFI